MPTSPAAGCRLPGAGCRVPTSPAAGCRVPGGRVPGAGCQAAGCRVPGAGKARLAGVAPSRQKRQRPAAPKGAGL
ncbi:MAG: hypothetical protein EPO52_13565 [Herbiconiux sp.]|nr:MAG: hypothetical protein EPO52_13565 [Herbiconiux sp.]